ncbi:MAG: YbbR-like domain-containing protein [Pedobacter sp.]|jgi:hypothetical protein
MPFIKFTKVERRRISLFFVCLLLAAGAWMFFALSNKYVYQVQTLVRFVNLPENKAFHPLQSDTVKLQVEGTGWQLLFSKLRINPQSVDIDLKELRKHTFIELSDQIDKINKQFASIQKVVYIQPDTLYFDFSSSTVKKIPVRLRQNIEFKKQFGISDSAQISPSYVTITGPRKELEQIKSWDTQLLRLKNVSADISMKINLQRPAKANITVHPGIVDLKIHINEFTEKVVEAPVKVLNNHEFRNVKLLPEKVKITFLTALNNYSETDRSSFEPTVDLNNWKDKGYAQLPVKISRFPKFSKIIKIEPQTIDFIIQK